MMNAGNNMNSGWPQSNGNNNGGVYPPVWQAPNVEFSSPQMGGGNSTTTKVNMKLDGDSEEAKNHLKAARTSGYINDIGAAVINTMNSAFQYSLASQSMGHQADLMGKYYETQTTIAGYQKEVAMEQMFVQMEAVRAQRDIAKIDGDTAIALRKYEAKAEADIARIQEQGKTDRCEKMAAAGQFGSRVEDPFSRGSYYYG
ncbi:MAG TPA: hypothetical protein PLZ86_01915 [bacterium]|nr:hypothetical protein [bacterium]